MSQVAPLTVELTHPDGLNLRFSQSLVSFLAHRRSSSSRFRLGHWIATLDDEALYHLEVLSMQANVDPDSLGDAVQDLLLLVITATAAETRQRTLRVQEEAFVMAFGCVYSACLLERFARAGWLILDTPCSIRPHVKQRVRLTEAGMQQGQAWAEQFKAMMH